MKPLVKVPLIYGAIAGALGIAVVIVLYYADKHPFLIPVYIDYRVLLFGVFIFFTLRELRDYHFGGILYFWQGLAASFIFTFVFAALASLSIGIFGSIVPEFVTGYIDLSVAQLKSIPADIVDRIGKDVYQRNLELLPATDASDLGWLYFWQSFMIGLFVSIILSVILRRQPKP